MWLTYHHLERMWKEVVVAYFEVDRMPRHMLGDTFETTKTSVDRKSVV